MALADTTPFVPFDMVPISGPDDVAYIRQLLQEDQAMDGRVAYITNFTAGNPNCYAKCTLTIRKATYGIL